MLWQTGEKKCIIYTWTPSCLVTWMVMCRTSTKLEGCWAIIPYKKHRKYIIDWTGFSEVLYYSTPWRKDLEQSHKNCSKFLRINFILNFYFKYIFIKNPNDLLFYNQFHSKIVFPSTEVFKLFILQLWGENKQHKKIEYDWHIPFFMCRSCSLHSLHSNDTLFDNWRTTCDVFWKYMLRIRLY